MSGLYSPQSLHLVEIQFMARSWSFKCILSLVSYPSMISIVRLHIGTVHSASLHPMIMRPCVLLLQATHILSGTAMNPRSWFLIVLVLTAENIMISASLPCHLSTVEICMLASLSLKCVRHLVISAACPLNIVTMPMSFASNVCAFSNIFHATSRHFIASLSFFGLVPSLLSTVSVESIITTGFSGSLQMSYAVLISSLFASMLLSYVSSSS